MDTALPLLAFVTCLTAASAIPSSYLERRNHVLSLEAGERTGGGLKLSSKEQAVSDVMTAEKARVINAARVNDSVFPPAMSFFQSKKYMDQTLVYKIIRDMPKGGVLHLHHDAGASLDWVIHNLTYRHNVCRGFDQDGDMVLEIFHSPPRGDGMMWQSLASLRAKSGDASAFDDSLYRNLSIIVDDPDDVYPTTNAVWRKFDQYFKAMTFLSDPKALEDYIRRTLEEFLQDNVQYIEFRFGLSAKFSKGSHMSDDVELFKRVFDQFQAEHPNFIGAKLIFTGIRFATHADILDQVKEVIRVRQRYPDLLLGFDLVAQEDLGQTQYFFLDQLLYPDLHHQHLPYFFHAGETRMEGNTDLNLIDAVLLNTSRIGHGFALLKHPEALRVSKERGIAIEVNPISNQVLGLVSDLRNHPAAVLLANNHPVVISSDDPSVWGASPLSHDFYVTFMALTSEQDDLRVLKQLAMNSIMFSGMTSSEKAIAINKWHQSWDKFIDHAFDVYVTNAGPVG